MKSDQQTPVPVIPGAMETLRLPADVHLSPDRQRTRSSKPLFHRTGLFLAEWFLSVSPG
jgi:hypothetical protein